MCTQACDRIFASPVNVGFGATIPAAVKNAAMAAVAAAIVLIAAAYFGVQNQFLFNAFVFTPIILSLGVVCLETVNAALQAIYNCALCCASTRITVNGTS
ncbi:MAG TPA: hypothetical protein VIJ46_03360 [Rhabdochlamydiaceae bacterium]